MRRSTVAAVTLLALLSGALATLAACSVKVDNNGTSFACGDGGTCPTGFACENAYCVATTGTTPDAAIAPTCGTAVTSGEEHSCALRSDGTVWCWGRNDHGQLGDGTLIDRATPVQALGVAGVSAIGAGSDHTCAVAGSGDVYCWGANASGQLGIGGTTDTSTPAAVPGITTAHAIAAGEAHTCALLVDGTLTCWGDDDDGQLGFVLGSGSAGMPQPPTSPQPAISGVIALAAGGNTTCAVFAGAVNCWGANDAGQFGNTSQTSSSVAVPVGGTQTAMTVAVGRKHVCAVNASSQVVCWGDNSEGQLGDGSLTSPPTSAVTTVALPVAASTTLSAADAGTCVVDTTGAMWCWGNDQDGELGDALSGVDRTAPVRTQLTDVAALTAGARHTCVRHTDGAIQCVGNDERGQLGDGLRTSQTAPTPVAGLGSNVAGVSAGGSHTCAWLADGSVRCWGANADGELGDGTTIDRDTPITVAGVDSVRAISAGNFHTCALGSASASCWGDNTFGQLGTGDTTSSSVPVPVRAFGIAGHVPQVLSAGGRETCVAFDSQMQCWGTNADGELGINTSSASTDVAQNGSDTFTTLSAGSDNACGIKSDGSVSCWGSGGLGQDGNAQHVDQYDYVGLNNQPGSAMSISAADDFVCGLFAGSASSAWCWGNDSDNELGDGDGAPGFFRQGAFPVAGVGSDVGAVWTGGQMGCAQLADNSLWCWGTGSDGQFADFSSHPIPVQVASLSGATYQVSIGTDHLCVLQSGAVSCWGADTHGQLGDGVPDPFTPRTVALTCPTL